MSFFPSRLNRISEKWNVSLILRKMGRTCLKSQLLRHALLTKDNKVFICNSISYQNDNAYNKFSAIF